MSRTVRDVLTAHLQVVADLAGHPDGAESLVEEALRDLADVLSTGPGWKTREVAARLLEAGDVIVDRNGRLHAVDRVTKEKGLIGAVIRRAGRESTQLFAPEKAIPVLLTTTDQRALDLLAAELGTELVAREVA